MNTKVVPLMRSMAASKYEFHAFLKVSGGIEQECKECNYKTDSPVIAFDQF